LKIRADGRFPARGRHRFGATHWAPMLQARPDGNRGNNLQHNSNFGARGGGSIQPAAGRPFGRPPPRPLRPFWGSVFSFGVCSGPIEGRAFGDWELGLSGFKRALFKD